MPTERRRNRPREPVGRTCVASFPVASHLSHGGAFPGPARREPLYVGGPASADRKKTGQPITRVARSDQPRRTMGSGRRSRKPRAAKSSTENAIGEEAPRSEVLVRDVPRRGKGGAGRDGVLPGAIKLKLRVISPPRPACAVPRRPDSSPPTASGRVHSHRPSRYEWGSRGLG